MNNETRGLVYGFLGVSAFGLTLPVTRYISPYFDPVFIGLGRAVLAALIAGLILFFFKEAFPNRRQILQLIIVAFGVVIGFPVLTSWAMQSVPASHGGVVLGILPLGTAIMGAFISDESPSLGFWVVGGIGSLCVIIFSLVQSGGSLGSFQLGDVALIGAVVSASIGYAVGGALSKELGGWQTICWALVLALPFIVIPAWFYAPKTGDYDLTLSVFAGFLYLALVSQLFGFFLWYKGLALGGITRVSQVQLLQPFITIIVSAVLLKEQITNEMIGFAFLIVMIVFIGKRMQIQKVVK